MPIDASTIAAVAAKYEAPEESGNDSNSEIESAEPVETEEAHAPQSGEDGSEVEGEAVDAASEDAPEKATKDKKDDPKFASKFAALAREKAKARTLSEEADQKLSQVAQREQQLAQREQQLQARAQQVEAKFSNLLNDPDQFFAHLDAIGVTEAHLQKFAREGGKLQPEKRPVEQDPRKRPLTMEDMERIRFEETQNRAFNEFAQISSNDEKYEASNVLYSSQERVRLGDEIAKRLVAAGHKFTLEDIADLVEEYAEKDVAHERYKFLKKHRQAKGAALPKTAEATASKASKSVAQKSSSGTTLSNRDAQERASTNGISREARREYLKRLSVLGG